MVNMIISASGLLRITQGAVWGGEEPRGGSGTRILVQKTVLAFSLIVLQPHGAPVGNIWGLVSVFYRYFDGIPEGTHWAPTQMQGSRHNIILFFHELNYLSSSGVEITVLSQKLYMIVYFPCIFDSF